MKPIHQISGRLGNQMFQLAYLHALVHQGVIPDIWLQYPKYFDVCADEIRQLYGTGIKSNPHVSIHVRRGDYILDPAFVSLWETDYYERAIARYPGASFLVFSDDPNWCKRKWTGPSFKIISGQTDVEDMNMMAGCHHNIIANSSFSWWAGYLNPNPHKTVVYPLAWHTDRVQRVGFPEGWVGL